MCEFMYILYMFYMIYDIYVKFNNRNSIGGSFYNIN